MNLNLPHIEIYMYEFLLRIFELLTRNAKTTLLDIII